MTSRYGAFALGWIAACAAFAEEPTWSRDVAPIVYRHCTECHRPDGSGPFPLASYADTRQRAKMIADVVTRRYMPPWKAERGELKFTNERGMTDAEINAIQAWVSAGTPEGDPALAPPTPVYKSEWHHGPPDILLEMEEEFTVPADGPDIYRNFVIRIPDLPPGKYLKGIDYKPRALQSAHHSLFSLDTTGDMRARSDASAKPGFSGMESNLSTRRVGGWAVGALPELFPEGIALAITPGTDLVLNSHFHPVGKPETERARVGLYLTDRPPTREAIALDIPFGFGVTANIRIPAGATNHLLESSFTLPADAELSGLAPHAHLLAREISAHATLPDGRKLTLIHVRDWDFNWQEQYRYAEPVHLPAGTRIDVRFVYDNSEANPFNPHHPPQVVTWGPETTDEMASVSMRFVSGDPAAIAAIRKGYGDWVKDSITKTDFALVEHAVARQEDEQMDLNGDGSVGLDEYLAAGKRAWRLLRGSSHDELGLVPFLAWQIVKREVLPRFAIVALAIAGIVWLLRRRRKRRQAA